jgi:hypothetical protein
MINDYFFYISLIISEKNFISILFFVCFYLFLTIKNAFFTQHLYRIWKNLDDKNGKNGDLINKKGYPQGSLCI